MIRFSVIFSLLFLVSHNIHSAGPACFNYETYEHQGAAAVGANRALVNYNHQLIAATSAAIPVLAPGVTQIGISKSRFLGAAPTVWQHNLLNLGGVGLIHQEKCRMTLERQNIGITVDFQHPNEIAAVAAGVPIPAVAAFFGWGGSSSTAIY